MGAVTRYVGRTFRGIAVLGAVAALAGFLALVAAGLEAASREGIQVYVDLSLTTEEAEMLIVGGSGALLGGVVLNLLGNTVANFASGFESADGTAAASGSGGGVPVSERYCRKLETVYLANGGVVASIAVLTALGEETFGLAGRFAEIVALILFGGLDGAVFVAAVLFALWYGVRERATEALVGGFFFAVLFFLSAVVAKSAGFAIFALFLGYYSLLARGATTFQFVEAGDVPDAIGERFD